MATRDDFINHVSDLFSPAGRVVTKHMFDGHGINVDGLFVAIIAWEEFYLQAQCRGGKDSE